MMSMMTQLQLAFEMWKDWMKECFGGSLQFPTEHLAPGYVGGWSK